MWHLNTTYFIRIEKIKLEPATIWKLVTCQRITSKNTRPRWADTWDRDTVRWYWAADTLFWQLSIYHNIDVQYVCKISFSMLPNELESVKLNIGSPVVRTDGRCWVDLLTHGAPLARFARGAPLLNEQINSQRQRMSQWVTSLYKQQKRVRSNPEVAQSGFLFLFFSAAWCLQWFDLRRFVMITKMSLKCLQVL